MSQYKLKTKEFIFSEMLKIQKALVQHFETSLGMTEADAQIDTESGFGGEAEARREANMEILQAETPHYEQNMHDLHLLENMIAHLEEAIQIAPGAVVLTDSLNFVIGVSMPTFYVENKAYIGISTHAPIYASLVNKHIGDTAYFGKQAYLIEDIF